MKRLLSLFLVLLASVGLVACKTDEVKAVEKVSTASIVEVESQEAKERIKELTEYVDGVSRFKYTEKSIKDAYDAIKEFEVKVIKDEQRDNRHPDGPVVQFYLGYYTIEYIDRILVDNTDNLDKVTELEDTIEVAKKFVIAEITKLPIVGVDDDLLTFNLLVYEARLAIEEFDGGDGSNVEELDRLNEALQVEMLKKTIFAKYFKQETPEPELPEEVEPELPENPEPETPEEVEPETPEVEDGDGEDIETPEEVKPEESNESVVNFEDNEGIKINLDVENYDKVVVEIENIRKSAIIITINGEEINVKSQGKTDYIIDVSGLNVVSIEIARTDVSSRLSGFNFNVKLVKGE